MHVHRGLVWVASNNHVASLCHAASLSEGPVWFFMQVNSPVRFFMQSNWMGSQRITGSASSRANELGRWPSVVVQLHWQVHGARAQAQFFELVKLLPALYSTIMRLDYLKLPVHSLWS